MLFSVPLLHSMYTSQSSCKKKWWACRPLTTLVAALSPPRHAYSPMTQHCPFGRTCTPSPQPQLLGRSVTKSSDQQATGGGGLVPLTACVQGRVATPASRDVRGVRARNGLRSTSCCRTAYSIPPWLGRGVCDDLGVTTHTTVRARTKATVGVSRTSLNACQRKAQRITATFTDAIWELRGYLLRRSCNLVRCKVPRLQFSLQPRHVTRR